jgi:signal transduction histidine kinase
MAVGVFVPEGDASYFEVFPLANVDRTLSAIGTSLAVAASFTAMAAAGVGWWASRRLLRPLSRVADAAGDLATGGLDTRLDEENDPDLDRLVSSFNEMADAVQSRIEREARFASDVSHELRSPLTALTAAVEVLDGRRDDLPARSQQALDVVVSQTRRFDQMVLDLLELSRLDAGAAELLAEPIDVGNVLRRVANRYGAENVPVEVSPPFDTVAVPVDKRRLERILANLIGNAEQHAGGAVRIAAERGRRGMLRVVVEDNGPGVSPEERERIFERFARGSTARHRVGTGLGLALVAEHAQLHGGRAWVEDRPGGGARFIVELPVVRA